DVFKFVGLETLSCLVGPTFGTTSLYLGGAIPGTTYGLTWWTWWLGDLIGMLLVVPALFACIDQPRARSKPRRLVELALLRVSVLMVSQIVCGDLFRVGNTHYPLTYTFLPFIIWAAFRFGRYGVTLLNLIIAVLTVVGTLQHLGPFVGATLGEA